MTNNGVTLVLPGLFPSFLDALPSDVPTLKKIVSKATPQKGTASFEEAIKTLFHGIGNGAVHEGPLGAYAAGILTDPFTERWCRVDFLECQIDHQTAFAVGNIRFALEPDEISQLIETFTSFFKEVGLDLHVTPKSEWYLRIHQYGNVSVNDILTITGKNLNALLPTGPDQVFWRRLLTECQMLLSTHPVNIKRRENNKPELSCLWFEGLGCIGNPVTTSLVNVYTDESSVEGLAKWAGIASFSLNNQFMGNVPSAVISRTFYRLVKQHAHDECIQKLLDWEIQWFKPLYQALMMGKISHIVIDTANGKQFLLQSQHKYYFWRRTKPLSMLTSEQV